MALTKAFYDAVNDGNIRRIRIMMKDSLLVDPSFAGFEEMARAAQSLKGLYDVHDGREFISDCSLWNDDYMDKLMVQVVNNFSHERIEHLKEVVHYLRPVPYTAGTPQSTENANVERPKAVFQSPTGSSYQEQKRRDQQSGNYRGAKIVSGVAAGAVVGGVVAAVAGVTAIGGAVVGATVGGVAVAVATNGGK